MGETGRRHMCMGRAAVYQVSGKDIIMSVVYFRTDGNEEIATGHIMRCLSIARACASLSMGVRFLVSDENSVSILKERFAFPDEFPAICLHSDYQAPEKELPALKKVLKEAPDADVKLFVDSYFVTETYLAELQKYCPTAYLDDLLAFDYPVDFIVNYDMEEEPACYRKAAHRLTGAAYTPLREQFQNVSYEARPKVRDIFLSAGGTDACNIIGALFQRIYDITVSNTADSADKSGAPTDDSTAFLQNLHYHVITSRLNSHFQELEQLALCYPTIHIHTNVQDMAALMKQCDLGISAGGTTLYELCAVGVPSVSVVTADNQRHAVETFSDKKIILCAGDACVSLEKTVDGLIAFLNRHKDSYSERKESSQRMRTFIDGRGAFRIASALKNFETPTGG